MIIATAACVIFLAYPLLLSETGFAYEAADTYFSGLGDSDYKSSFLESIGGMLGTFLAITGALWTQHYFEQEQEHKEDIQNTTVIYYDFKFAFTEIKEKLEDCAKDHSAIPEQITPNLITGRDLHDKFTSYRIQIDSKWINNVAKLPYNYSSDESSISISSFSVISTFLGFAPSNGPITPRCSISSIRRPARE